MPAYKFVCPNNHSTEIVMTFSEWDEHCKVAKDEEGRVITECAMPECLVAAHREFTSSPAIYNAPGFYGAIGTVAAHNSGHM